MKLLFVIAALGLVLMLPLAVSQAQDAGYVAGNLNVQPSLDISETYSDNIYTEDTQPVGDFITIIKPELRADILDKPYDLEFKAGLLQTLYADETQNDYLNYTFGTKYEYKVDPTLLWHANASHSLYHEMPGDDDADPSADAGEPLPYTVTKAGGDVRKKFGGLIVEPRLGFMDRDYENVRRVNGTLINQNGRDRKEYVMGGRIGYAITKTYEVFTDVEYSPRDYDLAGATGRDSKGGNALIGLRYRPGKAFMVEVAAGYMRRNYETALYDDIHAPDAHVRMSWAYSDTGKLNFNYNRSIAEVTDAGTGGAVIDDLRLTLKQTLSDQLTGKIEGRYRHADYRGGNGASGGLTDRTNDFYSATLGLNYALNDRVALTADLTRRNNQSNRNTSDYAENIFMLGIKTDF